MMFLPLLAQEGTSEGVNAIREALALQSNMEASWNKVWNSVLPGATGGTSTLWDTAVQISGIFTVFCLIYLFIRCGNELSKTRYLGTIVEMFQWPLAVVILLAGNGTLLGELVRLFRDIGDYLVSKVLSLELADLRLAEAVSQAQAVGLGTARARQILNECAGLAAQELTECLQSKAPELEAIPGAIQAMEPSAPTGALDAFIQAALDLGGGVAQGAGAVISGDYTQFLQDRMFPIIQAILYAMQWAFVNVIECALVLTAILLPFAVALSLLPLAGRPIFAWLSAFLTLYGVKLCFSLIIAVVAVTLSNASEEGVQFIATDFGFAFFTAVFAPAIAVMLSSWGGVTLFQGISRRASAITSAASSGAATILTGGFLK